MQKGPTHAEIPSPSTPPKKHIGVLLSKRGTATKRETAGGVDHRLGTGAAAPSMCWFSPRVRSRKTVWRPGHQMCDRPERLQSCPGIGKSPGGSLQG